jgi:hypothetical protein
MIAAPFLFLLIIILRSSNPNLRRRTADPTSLTAEK